MTTTENLATEPTTEDADTVAAAAKLEQAKIDAENERLFEAFKVAADEAFDHPDKDSSTNSLPVVALEPVKAAYRQLPGAKLKNRAKEYPQGRMAECLNTGDLEQIRGAVTWNQIHQAIKETTGGGAPATRQSPDALYASRVQTLRLAADALERPEFRPEGVSEDWESEIKETDTIEVLTTYLGWAQEDEPDPDNEPDASAVVKAAAKLVLAKTVGGKRVGPAYSGPKRNVGKHIAEVFENVESGTFLTVTEIVNTKTNEYADQKPSAGAVNQKLRPGGKADPAKPTKVPGIRVEKQDGVWGATKL